MQFPLLETDQTHCYDAAGFPLTCRESGQDASRAKRLQHAASRFQIQGDLVQDTFTGALWCRNAALAEFPLTFAEACDFVADLASRKAYGHANWQLPPRRLLFSLLSHQFINPALPEKHPFLNVFHGYYWARESAHGFPDQGWHIHLGGGRVPRAKKQESSLVWPVCPPENGASSSSEVLDFDRFVVKGASARDILTGLVWSLDACPAGGPLPWQDALAAVADFNQKGWQGKNDWRMPNVRELESLVDLDADSPALPPGHPFHNVRDVYWSATTSLYEPRYAWALYTLDGGIGVGFKIDPSFHLWPVRGG